MGFSVERTVIFWLLYDLGIRWRVFLLYVVLSTEQHDETTFPSCHPPHNIFTVQVGGRKKEGTSHDRHLWCCRRFCDAVTTDAGGKVQEQLCSTVAHLQCAGTACPFLYFTPLLFSDLLAPKGCGRHHFQTPHQGVSLCFAIQSGVVPQGSPHGVGLPPWPRYGHARQLGHLSHACIWSEMSHIFDTGTSQLQGMLQRDKLKVQQGSWVGKGNIYYI